MKRTASSEATRVALIYALVSSLYIFFSDRLLETIAPDVRALSQTQTYKGVLFVLLSGALLYFLLRQAMTGLLERQRELEQSRGALAVTDATLRALVNASPLAILILDGESVVRLWSKGAESMFGWTSAETLGRLLPIVPEDGRGESREIIARTMAGETVVGFPAQRLRKDGGLIDVSINTAPLRDPDGRIRSMLSIVADVHEEKRAKEAMENALREREALLKEVHHRVKNNMQVVTSLVSIQARRARPECKTALREIQSRIVSMALVHEQIYRADDFRSVRLDGFVRKLASHLFAIYGQDPADIELRVETDKTTLDVDKAVPCGLILGELMANSLKHAFPEGRGEIAVTASADGDRAVLRFADNGRGLPEGTDPKTSDGIGFLLLRLLTEQLGGDFRLLAGGGASYEFVFPLKGA